MQIRVRNGRGTFYSRKGLGPHRFPEIVRACQAMGNKREAWVRECRPLVFSISVLYNPGLACLDECFVHLRMAGQSACETIGANMHHVARRDWSSLPYKTYADNVRA